ncbi:MAG: right-handed parallel beta-helix repeat-containing protein [Methanospirillum sp.]
MHQSHIHRGRLAALPPATVLLLALCLLAAGAQALAAPLDDAALAAGADEIVRGEITAVSSAWDADHARIWTTATVRVAARLKGDGNETLTLAIPGGTVDGVTLDVEDQPVLAAGTGAFIFVARGPAGEARVYGGEAGVVPLEQGRVALGTIKGGGVSADAYGEYLAALAAGRPALAPTPSPAPRARAAAATVPVITNVSPERASAGTGATITITGSGFGTKASRDSYADVGFTWRFPAEAIWASGYPVYDRNPDGIVFWSDTRIVVTVPTGYTASGAFVTAASGYVWVVTDANAASGNYPFGVTFSYGGSRWNGPVSYRVNETGMIPGALGAITGAADAWNALVPDADFRLEYAGASSTDTIGADGENLVLLGDPDDFAGVFAAALTYVWRTGDRIDEVDLVLNPYTTWTLGPGSSGTNLPKVALHEFGHWLYLKDLYGDVPGYPTDEGKVMFGEDARFLPSGFHPDDVAGIRWCYANASPPSPTPTAAVPRPFNGPHPVPGRVEAEDFDTGGEGVAYHDTTPANEGGAYRAGEGVDLETAGGRTNVGWVRRGEWLSYTVTSSSPQRVALRLRASNPDAGTRKSVTVYAAGAHAGWVEVLPTGSFDTYVTATGDPEPLIWLPAGETAIRLELPDRVNIDYLELVPAAEPTSTPITKTPTPTPEPTPRPYPGPHELPCTIEAEDYDTGGEGVAYHDTTAGNAGGVYRNDDVDIGSAGGATVVTDIRDGEWLVYTVNASAPQDVVVRLRASNPGAVEREVTVLADGIFSASAHVPPTGPAGSFTTVDSTEFSVGAGETALRLWFPGADGPVLDRFEVVPYVPPPQWALEITEPGRYVLDRDLAGQVNGVRIAASDVVLDGAGHAVLCTGAAGAAWGSGVSISGPSPEDPLRNVTVRDLAVRGWSQGLDLQDADGVLVEDVAAEEGTGWGLREWGCDAVAVRSSTFAGNAYFGVALYTPGAGVSVTGCSVTGNGMAGIAVVDPRDAGSVPVLEENGVSDNSGWGIIVEQSTDSGGSGVGAAVRNSTVLRNGDGGVVVRHCEAVVRGDRIDGNGGPGVSVILGGTGRVTRNRVEGNDLGLATGSVGDPSTLEAWDNVLNNTVNADFAAGGTIRLNATRSAGPNVVGGPSIGGNFWAAPDGTGFSRTHPDADGDGFCDEPFVDSSGAVDYLPLAAAPALVAVPGGAGAPTDTDGDGLYDDVNGNGRRDFADVVLYFNQMSWIAANEPVAAFDCNGNGRIDFADVAWLFARL